jgi:glucose-6-phosphate isomerase
MRTTSSTEQRIGLLQKSYTESPKLRNLLQPGSRRFEQFSRKFNGLLFDFSRVAISGVALDHLLDWADQAGVAGHREKMFGGEAINNSEKRPVLHHLWRSQEFAKHLPAAEAKLCEQSLERLHEIASALHVGHLPGSPETNITDIVHIGIGGSLIGPRLLCEALSPGLEAPSIHFLSSVDAYDRECLLAWLDPASTAIVLVSKSFTTTEVLAHGRHMRDWMRTSLGEAEANRRLVAVTSAPAKAVAFGVPEQQVLAMGEWTGGRYSIWSPVGLTVAASAGPQAFADFCSGGAAMDQHFRTAPPAANLPLLHGLLSVWHRNICGYSNRGLIPYDSRLRGLPAWLQQLQMESNGKSVTRDGAPVRLQTSPMVFGDCGTDAQHALFQAFHQGTEVVPLDFVGVVLPDHDDIQSQKELLSHLLAQATALAFGRNELETRAIMQAEGKPPEQIELLLPHRLMPGNRPSSILLLDQLTPEKLGLLMALYEHSIFVESVIWQINAFDQWGVELGKVLAGKIEAAMASGDEAGSAELASLLGIMQEINSRLD